jgi:hypothetical protein
VEKAYGKARERAGMIGIGAAQERMERMLLHDLTAHIAWVDTTAWRRPARARQGVREAIAAMLVSLARRIAPTVELPRMRTKMTTQ